MDSEVLSPFLPLSTASWNRATRTNPAQWSVMVDFLLEHPEMVTRSFTGLDARQNYKMLWDQLANNLNCMGYGSKSADKWIEAFTKWKSKVKAKAQQIKLAMKKTGGGGPLPPLTPIEVKLMGIIGWTIVDGDGTPELGLDIPTPPAVASAQRDPPITNPPLAMTKRPVILQIPPLFPLSSKPAVDTVTQITDESKTQDLTLLLEPHRDDDNVIAVPGPSSLQKNKKRKQEECTNTPSKRSSTSTVRKGGRRGDQAGLSKMHEETMMVLMEISFNIARVAEINNSSRSRKCTCKCTCGNS